METLALRPAVPLPVLLALPSQRSAACSPSNELYYTLCGGHASCSEAVFNLGAVNGGGRLFVCL